MEIGVTNWFRATYFHFDLNIASGSLWEFQSCQREPVSISNLARFETKKLRMRAPKGRT
jgi:hypothetical protein